MTKEEKEEYYKKVSQLEAKFSIERDDIGNFLKENIIDKLSDIKSVSNVQVHAASQRHRLSDKISTLKSKIRKHSERLLQERKRLYHYYKVEYNIRLSDYEITRHIDADVEPKMNFKIVLENQIDYYKRTIESIDKIGFSIKYLIEAERFLSGY